MAATMTGLVFSEGNVKKEKKMEAIMHALGCRVVSIP